MRHIGWKNALVEVRIRFGAVDDDNDENIKETQEHRNVRI